MSSFENVSESLFSYTSCKMTYPYYFYSVVAKILVKKVQRDSYLQSEFLKSFFFVNARILKIKIRKELFFGQFYFPKKKIVLAKEFSLTRLIFSHRPLVSICTRGFINCGGFSLCLTYRISRLSRCRSEFVASLVYIS